MSTHSLTQSRHLSKRSNARSVLSGIGGVLLALQLWLMLSSTALAALRPALHTAATPLPFEEALARVSVVRLVATYTTTIQSTLASPDAPVATEANNSGPAASSPSTILCTGLGVLVANSPAQNTQGIHNWVLTDGSLVDTSQHLPTCASTQTTASVDPNSMLQLKTIAIYYNLSYNNTSFVYTWNPSDSSVTCQSPTLCSSGLVLVPLPNAGEPFIDFASGAPTSLNTRGITLTLPSVLANASPPPPMPASVVPPSASAEQAEHTFNMQAKALLTPHLVPSSSSSLEPGTPFINTAGQLAGIHINAVNNLIPASAIQSFITQQLTSSNTSTTADVHNHWQRGVNAYYKAQDMTKAKSELQAATSVNPNFSGAATFLNTVVSPTPAATASGPSSSSTLIFPGFSIDKWLLSILGLLLLIILFLITTFIGRSRRRRRRALKADLAEAERRATIEAQQIAEMEAAQRGWAQHSSADLPTVQALHNSLAAPAVAPLQLRCPRCGELVARDATYCTSCNLLLSPSESGLHMRIHPHYPQTAQPPQTQHASWQPEAPHGNQHSAEPAIPVSVITNSSVTDMPTMPQSSPPSPAAPVTAEPLPSALPVAEQPTVEITSEPALVPAANDSEKTLPYVKQQVKGRRLGIVVGTRTDPGIKRKYKPNEDSLFAAQGQLTTSPQTQPFGLFVVADGMGGHANGQDASRMAIQNLIEYVLPRLTQSTSQQGENAASENMYTRLLHDGIQIANQSVHEHNVEQHSDMGTTVTAALIISTTAYIANVGDSRTYLYRASEGLKKITNDHSVVASLVEAGIIQPDDIYTHPKRSHIYRSLGEKAPIEIDLFTQELQEGDKLVLCSDGLWDMVRDPKIEEVIKNSSPDPSATGEALVQAALQGGGEDNVSVIVVHVTANAKAKGGPRVQLIAKPDTVQMPQL